MALVLPLPSHPPLDYTILKSFVDLDPPRFILGPSPTDEPSPADFSFSSDGLPLRKAIHLQSWYSSASTGKSLQTWPSVSEAYLAWLDRVEAVFEPLTPTFFDVAAIIGLRPHGVTISTSYNPDGVSNFEAHLDFNDLAYSKFIPRQFGFVQSILAPSKFFTANTADYRPPTKPIPTPLVLASEKRLIEAEQSIPPPPKRCKSVVKRPHFKQAEDTSSADVSKKRAEETPSALFQQELKKRLQLMSQNRILSPTIPSKLRYLNLINCLH
uniref:Uncharacterized protein n=1 Tax=Ananas comosus var. bracteatus TaxID=296719 RepID=A0A6V7PXV7_ANACO|nr:unnamed protein product [Ananas comosus var. bracteatus]